MRRFVISALLVLAATLPTWAQSASAVELQIEALRAQLREVAEKEAELQVRARQLEEDLRPENVQRSVAHVGTTDASALREERRRQLERQKVGVDEQLSSLASSRSRLEAAITTAEAEAVRLRAAALGANNSPPRAEPAAAPAPPLAAPVVKKRLAAPRKVRPRKRSRPRRRV
jgi:hypothetical protein